LKRNISIVIASLVAMLVVVSVRLIQCLPWTISSLPKYPNARCVSWRSMGPIHAALTQDDAEFSFPSELANLEDLTFETTDTPEVVIHFYYRWLLSCGWQCPFSFVLEDRPANSLYLKNGCRVYTRIRFRGFSGFVIPLVVPQHHNMIHVEASARGETTAVKVTLSDRLIVKDPYLGSIRFRLLKLRHQHRRNHEQTAPRNPPSSTSHTPTMPIFPRPAHATTSPNQPGQTPNMS
jgi:hypothetical protein